MRALLLSAYDAGSHQRWRIGLVDALSNIEWTVLVLPPRFFSWRFRGNALTWSIKERETLDQQYDFILATSMTDIATLKGLVPNLQKMPTIIYFHENQFVYPIQHEVVQREVFHFCMLNIYTALAGDLLLFNSEYNRQSLLDGVNQLIRKMPDFAPKETAHLIEERSRVIPVPLEDQLYKNKDRPKTDKPLTILWNHRWEYDKAPERFFAAMYRLKEMGIDFRLNVVGQQFLKSPSIFKDAKEYLSDQIIAWGYQETQEDYLRCIEQSDVVVSTALHEFQGLALLEAVARGCFPLAPDRLSYSELLPKECLYHSHLDDRQQEMQSLVKKLIAVSQSKDQIVPNLDALRWSKLTKDYLNAIESITS
jgi:glycosyltransferase involved in cell wall biosynthesis